MPLLVEPIERDRAHPGIVVDIADGVARVLLEPTEAEWFFPLRFLPADVTEGSRLWFAPRGGSLVPVEGSHQPPSRRMANIAERLGTDE